jgi:hypothetical protein
VHECIRPDQVWSALEPGRKRLLVADDAFGSTEDCPDAAADVLGALRSHDAAEREPNLADFG